MKVLATNIDSPFFLTLKKGQNYILSQNNLNREASNVICFNHEVA